MKREFFVHSIKGLCISIHNNKSVGLTPWLALAPNVSLHVSAWTQSVKVID